MKKNLVVLSIFIIFQSCMFMPEQTPTENERLRWTLNTTVTLDPKEDEGQPGLYTDSREIIFKQDGNTWSAVGPLNDNLNEHGESGYCSILFINNSTRETLLSPGTYIETEKKTYFYKIENNKNRYISVNYFVEDPDEVTPEELLSVKNNELDHHIFDISGNPIESVIVLRIECAKKSVTTKKGQDKLKYQLEDLLLVEKIGE